MFTITMAEISDHAGHDNDGIVRGVISQSLFNSMYDSIESVEPVYAFNLDLTGNNVDFTDYTTEATSGVSNSFLPWGTNSTFSAGDAVYLASDEPTIEIRFTINTAGVWVGTGLEVLDSTDGLTANRVLTGVVDTSNGFRNGPGTYSVKWTNPATPRVDWSPVPGFIPARKWIVIRPIGFVSATVSPKMSMTYMMGGGVDFENDTSVWNAPMSDATFGTVSDVVYQVNSSEIFAFPAAGPGMDIEVHRKTANVRDVALEYYSISGTWRAFTNLDDPSDWMRNGPATLGGSPAVLYHIRWDQPADWDIMSMTIEESGVGPVILTGAFMRARVTTVSNIAPQVAPLARARARSLNVSGGVIHLASASYSALMFDVGVPPAVDTVAQLLNINTGASATVTFPSGVKSSCNLPLERLPLSRPLAVGYGEALLITWQSGGILQNVELVLQ
jgi:hypothetical protein